MMMMGMTAAANMAVRPTTLYQAAMELSINATINANVDKLNNFLIISGINIFIMVFTYITVYYSVGVGGSPLPNKCPYVPRNSCNGSINFLGIPGPCCT